MTRPDMPTPLATGASLLGPRYDYDGLPARRLTDLQRELKAAIDAKVRSGEYRFESAPCLVCGDDDMRPLAGKDRYGLASPIVICAVCGLIQTSPRMTQDSYRAFYNEEFWPLYDSSRDHAPALFANELTRGSHILRYLDATGVTGRLPAGGHVVEVGCGAGGILEAFRRRGFRTTGIDIGQRSLDYGRTEHGLDLRLGALGEVELPGRADLIVYSHVLEHLLDPAGELRRLRSALAHGGLLYVEVPGVRYLRRAGYDFLDTLQNAHVTYFTRTTLNNMVIPAGYTPLAGNDFIRSVFSKAEPPARFRPENDFAGTLRFLRRLEWERRFIPVPPFKVLRRIKASLTRIGRALPRAVAASRRQGG